MNDRPTDRIFITDLQLRCIIGINPEEREKRQDVLINVELAADLKPAGVSDNIDDAVDYKTIKQRIVELVEPSKFYLVERMAQRVAEICLENPRVQSAKVRIDKPSALRFAKSVGVEIARTRKDV